MSMRSFVTLSSVLLMAWLVVAFMHPSKVRGGVEPLAADSEELGATGGVEADDLAVSVSP